MDRTGEFLAAGKWDVAMMNSQRPLNAPSPFLMKANELVRLSTMETI